MNRHVFRGGNVGDWRVVSATEVRGPALAHASRLSRSPQEPGEQPAQWVLHGVTSNVRYASRAELTVLNTNGEPLARPEALCAALIPIKKTAQWWEMAQDERRAVFEERSHHTAIGLDYMPAIARQLIHCRDLGEPFDFLTWFEFAPEHASAFDELVSRLRATQEWTYVEREVDLRLERSADAGEMPSRHG